MDYDDDNYIPNNQYRHHEVTKTDNVMLILVFSFMSAIFLYGLVSVIKSHCRSKRDRQLESKNIRDQNSRMVLNPIGVSTL